MSLGSIIIFLLVLLFLEFCVFCYFTSDLIAFFTGKKPLIEEEDEEDYEEKPQPLVVSEEKWEIDELSDDEIKPLEFPDEKWEDDSEIVNMDKVNRLLFEVDPDFKIDQFYFSIFDLYSKIADYYSEDHLREVANLMSKELYQENVRQLDYFRKKNLQHIVQVKDYINCQILDAKIIEGYLYVKVELKVMCYDYIMNRATQKVVKGISDKSLYCVYHLILKRKLIPLHFSKMGVKQPVIPSVTNSSNLNDDKWILSANRVVRRRAK